MSARATPATDVLAKAGIPHRVLEYEAPERHGTARDERPAYGREAADGLGVDEERIFKTLVASIDGRLAVIYSRFDLGNGWEQFPHAFNVRSNYRSPAGHRL